MFRISIPTLDVYGSNDWTVTMWGADERRKQLAIAIQRYATRLSHYALRTPLQWFNFYDFWHVEHHDAPTPEHKAGASAELPQGNTQP